MRVLSLIPPMTQLNTPYPSTAYLTGFLRSRGVDAVQEDLALALVLKLLSREGLAAVQAQALKLPEAQRTAPVNHFLDHSDTYLSTIDATIAFLQGHDATLGHRICTRHYLPEGPRFGSLDAYADDGSGDPLAWAFGALGMADRAKHLATLYLNDLADVLRDAVDGRFEFVRYAESLAQSQPTFEPLAQALAAPLNLVDTTLRDLTLQALTRHQPDLVLISVPFIRSAPSPRSASARRSGRASLPPITAPHDHPIVERPHATNIRAGGAIRRQWVAHPVQLPIST